MRDQRSILQDLNPPQREAVTHESGPLMVIAGAGTGKTRVITYRIAHLIARGVPGEGILAITFTNKAAGEMRTRAERFVGAGQVWISTFHSLAARILRRHIHLFPPFTGSYTIYDEEDRRNLIKGILVREELKSPVPAVAHRIGELKNGMVSPEAFASRVKTELDHATLRVYRQYEAALQERNALDFDDLLARTVLLFEQFPDVARIYQERFQHVLIDEYQDTNRAQYVIGKTIADLRRNICITGDPDQSIYAWRGADIRNILRFEEDYPDARVVKLEENYRSTKQILLAAQGVIRHNRLRKEKDLWTSNPAGEPVTVLHVPDHHAESREVLERILEHRLRGVPLSEMAVFYRVNAHSRSIERAFVEGNIPYVIVGAIEFYHRKEVKDILAYLRFWANPRDAESLKRIVNVPPRGIGAVSFTKLQDFASDRGLNLLEALSLAEEIPKLTKKIRKGFLELAQAMEDLSETEDLAVSLRTKELIHRIDYTGYLAEYDEERRRERTENLSELVNAAAEYERAHAGGTLAGFLEEVSLVSDVDRWERGGNRVTLMTLHSAKGLEFRVVFICGVEDGLLPLTRANDLPDAQEEERRLFYVGMTRAKEKLYLVHAAGRARFGQFGQASPSPFLREVPEDSIRREGLPSRTGRYVPVQSEVSMYDLADPDPCDQIAPGTIVEHEDYGTGRVLSIWGRGTHARVTVEFEGGGTKQIHLGRDRLRRAED